MEAELYIIDESFKNNNLYSNVEIEEKTKRLAEDIFLINRHKRSNKLFVNYTTIYPVNFYSNYTIGDFLCKPTEVKQNVNRDIVNAILNIFDKAENTSITSVEVIEELLPIHNEDICHGIIAFHKIDNISYEFQLIYGIDSWYQFRRHFLGLYPINAKNFFTECSIYFPNLFIHERNEEIDNKILKNFSKSIIKHLGVLNDVLYTYRHRNFPNEAVKYQTLTAECNLEADAASRDNNDAKDRLTFEFINSDEQTEEVTCYPHLRLCRSDINGDTHYYQYRIYFHEGIDTIHKKKILIGHIGVHL